MPPPRVLLLGTCDTKLSELLYVRSHIIEHGASVLLMDVGRNPTTHSEIAITQNDLFAQKSNPQPVSEMDRGEAIKSIATAATTYTKSLFAAHKIHGAICIGGSGGTSLGAAVMRDAVPIGFPKMIVSTVASGNTSSFVGECDITMMNSVVDIAGQNSILNPILENAAGMIAGAANAYQKQLERSRKEATGARRKRVAITMFGVTTPAADTARQYLEKHGFEVIVFHATGQGGRAMENLILQDHFDGVLDLTTTELTDELIGGIMSAGSDRLTGAGKKGIPQIVCLGAQEVVNFGPKSRVPQEFQERAWYEHNPDVTLMRTSAKESRALGGIVSERLQTHTVKTESTKVYLPTNGLSMISTPGGPFADREADEALFDAVTKGLSGSGIEVVTDFRAINDEGFAKEIAATLKQLIEHIKS